MMRLWQAALVGVVGMLCAAEAQAGPVWTLDWRFGTRADISNTGRSVIFFTPNNTTSFTWNGTATVAKITESSSAIRPDPITHQNYGFYLKLTDLASHASRFLWFSGSLSGSLSRTTSNLTNRFNAPTRYANFRLGHDLYSVFLGPIVLPSARNHFHGSLSVRVTDPPVPGGVNATPEPPSWALAGVGLGLVGFGAWRRRTRTGP